MDIEETNLATQLAAVSEKHGQPPVYSDKDSWTSFMVNTYHSLIFGAQNQSLNGYKTFSLVMRYSSRVDNEFEMVIEYLEKIDGFQTSSRNFTVLPGNGVYPIPVYEECVVLQW